METDEPKDESNEQGLSPQRQVIAVAGNRCITWSGSGVLERLGDDLAGAVGKPRLAMLALEEGVADDLAVHMQRMLSSAGFRVANLALPSGEIALSVDCAQALAQELSGVGLTGDDALVVAGDREVLSLASWIGCQWCGGVTVAAIPTTLEAFIRVPGTPLDLSVSGVPELLHAGPGLSLMLGDPAVLALNGPSEGVLRARALMVQTAFVESAKAFETLVARSQTLGEGNDDALTLAQALETMRARGRIISSNQAAVRRALRYGQPICEALIASVGQNAPLSTLMAEGLRFSARLAWQVCDLEPDLVFAQDALLERLGLGVLMFTGDPAQLLAELKAVMARRTNRRFLSLPEAPGRIRSRVVEDEVLLAHFEAFCASRRPAP